jgi:flagellar motor switch protein FliM
LRDLFEPILRAKPRVDAAPAVLRTLRDWQAEQDVFQSLSLYNFKPLKGVLTLAIPGAFVSRLVDAFYGGAGIGADASHREFTRTEESLLARVSDGVVALLADGWREVAPIDPQLKSRETNVAAARIGQADESVVVCCFTIAPPQGVPAKIELVFPAAALRSVEGALATRSDEVACARGAEWREQLGATLAEVRIEARTVLARPELSLAELMQLKVGDVIPVTIPALVPLLVEGRAVAVGSIGEQDGKAALKIERVESRRNSQ